MSVEDWHVEALNGRVLEDACFVQWRGGERCRRALIEHVLRWVGELEADNARLRADWNTAKDQALRATYQELLEARRASEATKVALDLAIHAQQNAWAEVDRMRALHRAEGGRLPPYVRALALAVLEDDDAAAMALLDAVTELRERGLLGVVPAPAAPAGVVFNDLLDGFGVRVCNILDGEGIRDLPSLLALSADDLLSARGFGELSLKTVRQSLARHGLKLRGDP